ncbi:MAG TPA: PrpR N-terminal domain-containing protein, partial [Clostridia bacterium]|nr:PrpR N-terminal domain-containing protein [Clostridia bacterium]
LRILGIAPYEGMKNLMSGLTAEYPQIELSVFVGDLEKGVEIAKNSFYDNYDLVISRGGTATMLQQQISLPVIAIEVSMYDILCAIKLANCLNGKIAIVSFSNITSSAKMLCELLGYDVDIFTIESPDMAEPALLELKDKRYQAILCDAISNTTAKRLGINSYLITSGLDSIRQAFEHALLLCHSQQRLYDENEFFREVIRGQLGHTVIYSETGELFFSTLEQPIPEVFELLEREIPDSLTEPNRRITRNLEGMQYAIRVQRIVAGRLSYIAFFFTSRKCPLAPNQMGIRFFARREAEETFYNGIFSFAETISDLEGDIARINNSSAPVMVAGEDGTGKEPIINMIYLRSALKAHPLISINCSLLNGKSWAFLIEHHNSPLADEGNTIYFSNIDMLPPERRRQLLAVLTEMDVCRRNRVLFSCVCQPGEPITAAGAEFLDRLCCLSLHLPPLRSRPDRIPALVNLSLSHLNANLARQIIGVSPSAIELLKDFPWPHNYTQLSRIIRDLAVTAETATISEEDVRQLLRKEKYVGVFSVKEENSATPLDLNRTLDSINQDIALRVLEETGGNQTIAAKRLGISRTTLWRMVKGT